MSVVLYARNPQLGREAQLAFEQLDVRLKFNRPGTLQVTGSRTALAEACVAGRGLILEVDGAWVATGPVTGWRRTRNADGDRVTVTAATDDTWLWRCQALPVPTGPPYDSASHDVRTGPFGAVAAGYLEANLPRVLADVVLEVDGDAAGIGGEVTGRARFTVLGDLLVDLAAAAGDIRFALAQPFGEQLLRFTCAATADRTAQVRLSEHLGSLAGFDEDVRAPAATYVYAGDGEGGTARTIAEDGIASEWGRIETFVDQRQAQFVDELDQAIATALTDGAAARTVEATPRRTGSFSWPADYGLGDRIRVDVDGQAYDATVREIHITVVDGVLAIKPHVDLAGGPPRSVLPSTDRIRRLEQRLAHLESAL